MTGNKRRARQRGVMAGAGGRRLLAMSFAMVAGPSALVASTMSTPSTAFVVSPSSIAGEFCGCTKGQTVRCGMTLRSALSRGTHVAPETERRQRALGGLGMLWSGGRRTKPNEVTVNIERTSMNSRRISGSIVIDRPIEDVWLTLTDYNRLAEYVPNLTQSQTKPSDTGGIQLWQEGAQKIVGFDFRASVEMFMDEHFGDPTNLMSQRKLTFGLLDSRMFKEFDGEWRMQFNSRKQLPGSRGFQYSTKLFYMVHIRPKGPVPVLALEWQISNEVPNNLAALKKAAEAVTPEYAEMRRQEREEEIAQRNLVRGLAANGARMPSSSRESESRQNGGGGVDSNDGARIGVEAYVARGSGGGSDYAADWESDETLEAYIARG